MLNKKPKLFLLFIFSLMAFVGFAQPTWTLDPFGKEKKPVQYEEKKLASEKTGDKKFTRFRRVVQNTTTHYNFYFNANNKLNAVVERAKLSQKDDYAQMLSFYPYALENTAAQKTELDSVIYKATAGILLHDLRSDWVDNMYLLIGKSYFLQQKFDSAALTFQFINYNLFPRKKDEDDRIVGTNDASSSSALSIANKEKRNIVQKVFTLPPSRNDALIWLTRTFIEQGEYGDAAGMINILQHDQNMPQRLKNDLEEVMSYWFFAQNNYDSSAYHLEKALSNADSKEDKSRWEFLLAQLYEKNGAYDQASEYYNQVSKHTTNPVMDIYAQLNDAKMMRNTGNTAELDKSIQNLLKMARKDKYENYRDIIYYSSGQLLMQRPDTGNAQAQYLKSIYYTNPISPYRNKSFLQLADIAYTQKRYLDAHNYYDSLDLTDKALADQANDLTERKETLGKIVTHIIAINREDSLQDIAALAPADRDALLKKMVKKNRKQQGLKEEESSVSGPLISFNNSQTAAPVDLFQNNAKGEWYFYNSNLRSRGLGEFKSKWGKRANNDNWRRKGAGEITASQGMNPNTFDDPDLVKPVTPFGNVPAGNATGMIPGSYDALLADIPLTAEKMDSSNSTIAVNMLALAQIFQNELFDFEEAISNYTQYLERFSGSNRDADAYLGLYYCYSKLGNTGKATYYKNIVTTKFSSSEAATKLLNPSLLEPNKKNPEATKRYEDIYNMFIEGNFDSALTEKKLADSVYGSNYWTPQLLYIEAMYNIKERKDSNAIVILNNLQELYPTSPLHDKASTMIDVLSRLATIEDYLTKLEVTRQEDEKMIFPDENNAAPAKPVTNPGVIKPTVVQPTIKPGILRDSIIKVPEQFVNGSFVYQADKPHYVVMILDKVDGVYINEAKNAFNRYNRESYYTQNLVITRDAIDGEKSLLLFGPFEDAATADKYFDKVKKAAPNEVSWLQASKYSFMIISEPNLQILKTNKDLAGYKKLLNANLGNKF